MRTVPRKKTAAVLLLSLMAVGQLGAAAFGIDVFPFDLTGPDGRDASRAWEGGGSNLAFVDDFSAATAKRYEATVEGSDPFDYYGGAIPESLGAPETWGPRRWRQDPYRWGQEGLDLREESVPAQHWTWDPAIAGMRFGSQTDSGDVYPAGSFGALVSPVIDLRNVPKPLGSLAVDSGREGRVAGLPGGVGGSAQNLIGGATGFYPDVSLEENETSASEAQGLVAVQDGQRLEAQPSAVQSTAALRLVHEYGFQAEDGRFQDGALVQVSSLDPLTGWSPWQDLAPSTATLDLGGEGLEGRRHVPGRDGAEARVVIPEPAAGNGSGGLEASDPSLVPEGSARISTAGAVEFGSDLARPWLYSGFIEASLSFDPSRRAWSGFGATSGGSVESVFDLTQLAGRQVRLRFVAAALDGDDPLKPGTGWRLQTVEVHAAALPAIDVVGFPSPGDGALVPVGEDFVPVVLLQNRLGTPARADVAFSFDGEAGLVRSVELGIGPEARRVVSMGSALGDLLHGSLPAGLHRLSVVTTVRPQDGVAPVQGTVASTATAASMHFQVGGPASWEALSVKTEQLGEGARDPEDRFVARGQPVRITVAVESTGPEAILLQTAGAQAEIRPVLSDRLGRPVGTFQPEQSAVALPIGRGTWALGQPDAVRSVSWIWSGNATSQPLDLAIEARRDGGPFQTVLDGGRILVESSEFAPLRFNAANGWAYGDLCPRTPEAGRTGLACRPMGSTDSPVVNVTSLLLERRGGQASLTLLHQGDGGTVEMFLLPDQDPRGTPPARSDAGWTKARQVVVPARQDWSVDILQFGDFAKPQPFSGWAFLRFNGPGGGPTRWFVDEARLDIGPAGKGLSILGTTFDVDLLPESTVLRPAGGGSLAYLDGARIPTGTEADQASATTPLGSHCTIENDDGDVAVHAPDSLNCGQAGPGKGVQLPAGSKAGGDSVLELPSSFRLAGARPVLSFRHWLGFGQASVGTVETAINGTDVWRVAAEFRGDPGVEDLRASRVPLWDLAGEDVRIRFRFHVGPEAAGALQESPAGWVIDAVQLQVTTLDAVQVLHRSGGFEGYNRTGVALADSVAPMGPRYPPVLRQATPKFERPAYHFVLDADGACSRSGQLETYAIGPSLVTDPIDLTNLKSPILEIDQGGWFLQASSGGTPRGGVSVFDVEYQVLDADGWGAWQRATPHQTWIEKPLRSAGPDKWSGAILPHPGRLADLQGADVQAPFTSYQWLGAGSNPGNPSTYVPADAPLVFTLDPRLAGRSELPGGQVARFRFHAWEEHTGRYLPGCQPGLFDWALYSMEIRDLRPLADLRVGAIQVDPDDGARIEVVAPEAFPGREGAAVLAGDQAKVLVEVRNQGRLPLRANVCLTIKGVTAPEACRDPSAEDALVAFIDTSGPTPRPTPLPFGEVVVEDGKTVMARFDVDFSRLPPGNYTVQAVVEAKDAVDTDPFNDVLNQRVLNKPVRMLDADPAASTVEPFVATNTTERLVRPRFTNLGNVDETKLRIEAEVVKYVGLTATEPLGYRLNATEASLGARGGEFGDAWRLPKDDAELARLLLPGQRYAVRFTVHPDDSSVTQWWTPAAGPLLEEPLGPLVNLTDEGRCGCLLVPFMVERLVAKSDLVPGTAASIVDGAFPIDGSPDSWLAETFTKEGGQFVGAEERGDLPRWHAVPEAEASTLADGLPSGPAWHLPAYEGRESVRNVLTSPVLPGHLVDPGSRTTLALRYANAADDGRVRLEQRLLDGDRWGEWEPIDAVRGGRIALVLPPDFPQVLADESGSPAEAGYPVAPGNQTAIPPFYRSYDPHGLPDGCDRNPSSPTQEPCVWAPFPSFGEGDPEWVRALADVLVVLADRLGTSNVGVFTTLANGSLSRLPSSPVTPLSPLNHTGGAVTVLDAGGALRFPLRGLDELGVNLGTYGAILLLGDGTTRTVAGESQTLVALSATGPHHGRPPSGEFAGRVLVPAGMPADPSLVRHLEDLDEILAAAPQAGVSVFGSIGPAVGTLARSGLAQGHAVTGWVNPGIPSLQGLGTNGGANGQQYRCLVAPFIRGATPPASDLALQPKAACLKPGQGGSPPTIDLENPWNYLYVSARDAQTLAIQDLVAAGGATFEANAVLGATGACPPHQRNKLANGPPPLFLCMVPEAVLSSPSDGPTIVTAATAADAVRWIEEVVRALRPKGELPSTGGAWQDLPLALGSPVGGRFILDGDQERFDGQPMQFRIVAESDPVHGGHGPFLLDGFELLGQPRTADLGVRILGPADGATLQPGEDGFHLLLEVANRGLAPQGNVQTTVGVTQLEACGVRCLVPEQPDVVVDVGAMDPGELRIVSVGGSAPALPPEIASLPGVTSESAAGRFFGGQFPAKGNLDPTDPSPMSLRFEAVVGVASGTGLDGIAYDDTDRAVVHGQSIVHPALRSLSDLQVVPNEAVRTAQDEVAVVARLHNDGSLPNLLAKVRAEVFDARPYSCHFHVAGTGNAYLPCDADQPGSVLPEPLAATTMTEAVSIARGGTAQAVLRMDLDAMGLEPGVYRIESTVQTFGWDGGVAFEQKVVRHLHLAGPQVQLDGGFAAHVDAVRGMSSSEDLLDPDLEDAFMLDDATDACMGDATTAEGGPANPGAALAHGWRWHPDPLDGCPSFKGSAAAIEWRRASDPSVVLPSAWSYQAGDPRDQDPQPGDGVQADEVGEADFGPDRLVWDPAKQGQAFGEQVNGIPLTLAAYPSEGAFFTMKANYQASPLTAYVVEMQVPSLACTGQEPSSTSAACSWSWSNPWLPLQDGDRRTSVWNGPKVAETCQIATPSNPASAVVCRRSPSNPLAGLPALWGANSAAEPDAVDGFRVVQYPIDTASQAGLETLCQNAALADWLPVVKPGFGACQYAATRMAGQAATFIPRPVRFRLSAASFGGDEGLNVWQVSALALTAHRLAIDGPVALPMHLQDGDSKALPFLVRNDGVVDDEVRIELAPADPEQVLPTGPGGLRWGVSQARLGEPSEQLVMNLRPGETRKVWAHVVFGHESGLEPGTTFPVPLQVRFTSIRDATAVAVGRLDTALEVLPRADLRIQGMVLGKSASGPFQEANGTPVSVTVGLVNGGRLPIGGPGQPILVRLIERRLDDATGNILDQREVANQLVEAQVRPCAKGCLVQAKAMDWRAPAKGSYELVAEANLPRPDDLVGRLPESDFANNAFSRFATIGSVPQADLEARSVRLVPVVAQEGCDLDAEAVSTAVAGHAYCIVANVANLGQSAALSARARFQVGSKEVSDVPLDNAAAGDAMAGQSLLEVASSPWVARLGADGADRWEVQVLLRTVSSEDDALNNQRAVTVRVAQHALAVRVITGQNVTLEPNQVHVATLAVSNRGNALTTPRIIVEGGDGSLGAHVAQPTSLLPGQANQTLEVVLTTGNARFTAQGLPRLFLSGQEDPRLRVPIPLRFALPESAVYKAEGLPFVALPGLVETTVLLDAQASSLPSAWRVVEAGLPLRLAGDGAGFALAPHARSLVEVPLELDALAEPGRHESTLVFLAGNATRMDRVEAVVEFEVLPLPALDAWLPRANASATLGSPGLLEARVANTGNVPIEANVLASAATGTVRVSTEGLVLLPGNQTTIEFSLDHGGQASRSLGVLTVQWRDVGGAGDWRNTTLPWSIEFVPAAIRLSDVDLDGLVPLAGALTSIEALVTNHATAPVDAEALAVVDGVVHGRQVLRLAANQSMPVELVFLAGPEGQPQHLSIVVRPLGSTATLEDAAFHDIGDAASATVTPQEGGSVLGMPSPAAALLLALLAIAAGTRRRRGP